VPGAAQSNQQVRTGKETVAEDHTVLEQRRRVRMTTAATVRIRSGYIPMSGPRCYRWVCRLSYHCAKLQRLSKSVLKNVSRCLYSCCYIIVIKTVFTCLHILSRLKNAWSYILTNPIRLHAAVRNHA